MTSSLARAGKALVALLTLGSLVLLSGCVLFGEHPPRASEAWEAAHRSDFTVASRHYGPGWGRIDGEDVIVFGYREGFDRSGGLPAAYGGSIYVIRADGTKLKRLSPSIGDGRGLGGEKAAYDISPDVSPDGRWLAYATHRHGNRLQIVTFELDGRGKGRIDGRGRHLSVPAWAPDGNTLAFSGLGGFTIAEPDGSNRRVIARDIIPTDERPAWSPDGKLLAFRSHGVRVPAIPSGDEGFFLHIAAVDGSSVTRVGDAATRPVWSPDGRHIAVGGGFLEVDGEPQWGIYVLDADGGNPRRIFETDRRPDGRSQLLWSPDGSEVWFQLTTRRALTAVTVATKQQRTFEELSGVWGMAWSPDGSRLAVVIQPIALGGKVLYTVAADGSDLQVLVRVGPEGLVAQPVTTRPIAEENHPPPGSVSR